MTKLNDSRRGNWGQGWTMGKGDILLSVGLGLPLLVVFLVYRYSRSLRSLSKGTARPPPGKFWQLPWIGESIQLLTSTPDNFVLPRLKKYGKIFRTHLFGQPAICITNPEAAKFVLQSPELFDVNWPESVKTLLGVDGIVHAQGELHARYRGSLRIPSIRQSSESSRRILIGRQLSRPGNGETVQLSTLWMNYESTPSALSCYSPATACHRMWTSLPMRLASTFASLFGGWKTRFWLFPSISQVHGTTEPLRSVRR